MAYISLISCLSIFGNDFDLLFGGKIADRILMLLVRKIELSERVQEKKNILNSYVTIDSFMPIDPMGSGPMIS